MTRILIIGKNSYIGKKLISTLKTQEIDRDNEGNRNVISKSNNKFHIDSISGKSEEWKFIDFSTYQVIILFSAIVHISEKNVSEDEYMNINYKMAVDIAKKSKDSNVKQFIFLSTAAVYGKQEFITKETFPNPCTFYGHSKLLAEKEISALMDGKFKVAIVRPPMVYGDGCKGNYQRLVWLANKLFIIPKVNNHRSVIHINNLVDKLYSYIINECSGYFHPQDTEYKNTTQWMVDIRKNYGKRTIVVLGFSSIVKFIAEFNPTINKLFGDFVYQNFDD